MGIIVWHFLTEYLHEQIQFYSTWMPIASDGYFWQNDNKNNQIRMLSIQNTRKHSGTFKWSFWLFPLSPSIVTQLHHLEFFTYYYLFTKAVATLFSWRNEV